MGARGTGGRSHGHHSERWMSKAIAGYLTKRSVHEQYPLAKEHGTDLAAVIVIPVLAESNRLFHTLRDLAANPAHPLRHTLILCVVNNRSPEMAGAADCADNQNCLKLLSDFAGQHPELRLNWINAASPGQELGPKEGVGLARKIGLDWGAKLLCDGGKVHSPLISLDADTRVPTTYLGAIYDHFQDASSWAAVVEYAHPTEGDGDETRAILAYELFLRYQEMALYGAGSPYHYPAIGSTMICTPTAYAAAGGMNRRQAGEDFYFLQQLAKTGRVTRLRDTVIAPSSRGSHRVPFGTGRKVNAFSVDQDDAYLTYDPVSYDRLGRWIRTAEGGLDDSGKSLLAKAYVIEEALGEFLQQQKFVDAWDRIRSQGRAEKHRLRQFHEYFDGFRTLKLTHYLRDNTFPRVDLFEALATVAQRQQVALEDLVGPHTREDLDGQRAILRKLRDWRPGG